MSRTVPRTTASEERVSPSTERATASAPSAGLATSSAAIIVSFLMGSLSYTYPDLFHKPSGLLEKFRKKRGRLIPRRAKMRRSMRILAPTLRLLPALVLGVLLAAPSGARAQGFIQTERLHRSKMFTVSWEYSFPTTSLQSNQIGRAHV